MQTALLFISTVFIWGTSWIAIAWQIGPVPILQSVFYRFVLSALVMLIVLALMGRLRLPKAWRFILVQALCLFSLNFLCFYTAVSYVPSGVVSVVFSLASIFNAVNARVFFGDSVQRRMVLAVLLGGTGVGLLLWDDLAVNLNADVALGIGWAVAGTYLFSLGNMASRANGALGVTPVMANVWGLPIGAMVLLALIGVDGTPLVLPQAPRYLWALGYLALIGTVLGFTTYLMLVARIGSAKAGYATVFFPIVALFSSSVFEGYEWTFRAVVGLGLAVLGNLVLFRR